MSSPSKMSPSKMVQSSIRSYMTPKIKKIYGYDAKTQNWHCIVCGENMGPNNPRQLCGKSFCYQS